MKNTKELEEADLKHIKGGNIIKTIKNWLSDTFSSGEGSSGSGFGGGGGGGW